MDIVNVKEMSEILKVNPAWLYQRTRNDSIPCIRVGRFVRFEPEKVIEFLKSEKRGGSEKCRNVV